MDTIRFEDGRAFIEVARCWMSEPLRGSEMDSDNGLPVARSMDSMDRAVNFIIGVDDWKRDELFLSPIERAFA